jgi:hypothetical protein
MTEPAHHDDDQAHVPNDPAALTVPTTEHIALQGGRGSTVSESGTRSALYVGRGVQRPRGARLRVAMRIAMLNAVDGGSAVTLMIALLDAPIGVAVAAGITTGVASVALYHRWQQDAHTAAAARVDPLLPSEPAHTRQPGHAPACKPGDA